MNNEKLNALKDYLSFKYELDIIDIIPVKNVVRIVTKEKDRCFKRVKCSEEVFLFILSAMKHLIENRFSNIIPFIPTRNGELYIELEDGFGFLTDWITSRECDFLNPVDIKLASTVLARLHRTSQGFIPGEGVKVRYFWGKWPEKFSSRIDEIKMFKNIIKCKDKLTLFDKQYIKSIDYFMEQGIESVENLMKTNYLELSQRESKNNSFCHHDFAHHNILIAENLMVYIIDFDYCICDTRLHDLSSLIIRNMRHGCWNMEKAQYIIDCYLKEGYLSEDEIPVINAFIEFPQDFWQVGLQYYIEKQKWDENHFNKRLDNVIKDIPKRQKFIEEFKYSIKV